MKKSELDLTYLKDSLKTLKDCYFDFELQNDEKLKTYIKDACVKRFEYTYEASKKIMNKYLKKEYDKTEKDLSINNIFREMYGLDLINNFENWVNYRTKRNSTSHEYDEKQANTIIDIIPSFIEDVDYFVNRLSEILVDD